MAKISKECIDGAMGALKNFSREEVEQYVRDVLNKTKQYDNLMSAEALDKAVADVNKENLQSLFEDAAIKANNTRKFSQQADKVKKKMTMRDLLAVRYLNLGDNVNSAKKAATGKLSQFFFKDLSFDEVQFLNSGKNDEMIADAFDGKKVSDPTAKKLADKLSNYFIFRNSELIISNAMRFDEINGDRMFRQMHDQGRIVSGNRSLIKAARDKVTRKYEPVNAKPLWKETIKKYLDMEKTFGKTKAIGLDGKVDVSQADKILENIFDNISTGKSEIFTRSVAVNDRDAVAKCSKMFFVFKDMRSFLEYNKQYGKNTLYGALHSDIESSGSKAGIASAWGDSPHNMYNDLRKLQTDVNPKDSFWWNNTDKYFKASMGQDRASVSPNVGSFFSNMRTLTSMARLVQISLQSVSDIGYVASFAQRMGINYFKAYTNQLSHLFNTFGNEERKYLADMFKTMTDSHLGFMGRWTDANNSSELINKMSTGFFKYNLLSGLDKGNKIGIMHLMSKHLANNSGKSFNSLNSSLKKWVEKFIDKDEWDLLRGKTKENRYGLFTTENADAVTDTELRSLLAKTGKDVPLHEYRNDLYRKVYSMFDVASQNAVLSPGDFERAWCFQGEAPGSIKGEFLRTISQFKMYTVSYIDRVLLNGWRDADTASQKLMWASSMLMGTLPLSMLSIYLGNVANGVSMPDWDMMNTPQREQFLVNAAAPSFATFLGLLDPRNQDSDMAWSLLSSPSTRLIGNSMAAAGALATGDIEKTGKHLTAAAKYIAPITSVPGITPFIRQAMGEQAYLQPGQNVLYGQ